jgi:Ni,Fe-hydrogenase I cytochrome b subunit
MWLAVFLSCTGMAMLAETSQNVLPLLFYFFCLLIFLLAAAILVHSLKRKIQLLERHV